MPKLTFSCELHSTYYYIISHLYCNFLIIYSPMEKKQEQKYEINMYGCSRRLAGRNSKLRSGKALS